MDHRSRFPLRPSLQIALHSALTPDIRESFGYKEPLFPQEMLDTFMMQKLQAHRTK